MSMRSLLSLLLLLLPLAYTEGLSLSDVADRVVKVAQLPAVEFVKRASELVEVTRIAMARFDADDDEAFDKVDAALAARSPTVDETVKALDRESTHLKVRALNDVVSEVEKKRRKIYTEDDETLEEFNRAYLESAAILGDALKKSVLPPSEDELFIRVARLTEYHQVRTSEFMKDILLIHTQMFVIEATYRHFRFNSTEVDLRSVTVYREDFAKLHMVAKMVQEKVAKMAQEQLRKDLRALQHRLQKYKHCQFAAAARKWFEAKYPDFSFAVVSYDPVTGFNKHAYKVCPGPRVIYASLFREANRNTVVVGFQKNSMTNFRDWATKNLEAIEKFKATDEYTKDVLKQMDQKMGLHCGSGKVTLQSVITTTADQCAVGPPGRSGKAVISLYDCNTSLCWVKHSYDFMATLFG